MISWASGREGAAKIGDKPDRLTGSKRPNADFQVGIVQTAANRALGPYGQRLRARLAAYN